MNGVDEVVLQDIVNMSNIAQCYEWLLDYCLRKRGLEGKLTPKVKKLDGDNPYFMSYYLYIVSYTYKRI